MERELLERLPREEAVTAVENGSRLSRRALTTIPFTQKTQLQDPQVQVALYIRTLLRRRQSTCPDCGQPNTHGHEDVCAQRVQRYNIRHDGTRNLLARGLRNTRRTQALVEPPVEERFGQRRTELRVAGVGAENGSSIEFDLTFTSLATKQARTWLTKRTEQDKADEEWAKGAKHGALWSIGKHLEERARDKVESYRGQTSTAFKPMVFSVGGAETINEFLDDRAELYLQSYFRYNGIQRIRMYWREQITSVNSKSWAGANLPGGKSLNIIEFEALIAEFNHI
ncbi:hypothetical protein A4X06_0g9084 [Tilletia controversa]|uniref:Uncharacterized protein n=1 Tax=Tilletia controversa TaxID=13291 RepID=A0A8X7MJH5_9BASI|nr:hypothetical protein A4X06_0g9084 [Tilletia controversa]